MPRRIASLLAASVLVFTLAGAEPQSAAVSPEVVGAWVGDWGGFNPADGAQLDETKCKALDCQVVRGEKGWVATFEGECGRPYKYTITMDGRQAGDVVLFKGTVDLGPKDGGVYDWIGRATDKDFVGFYTSPKYTGLFRLKRAAADVEKNPAPPATR